jgi:hypothetical protein
MNDVQRQLADLLKAGVGDPPVHVTVQAVRRQRARRRLAASGGAAVAIAVVAAVSVALSGQFAKPGPAAGPGVSPAPVPCRPGWSLTAGAVPAGDSRDSLTAIAGSAPYDLWAVGYRNPRGSQKEFPLLEHWNGRQWAYYAGASLGGRQANLTSVSASAWNDVWAVGNFMPGGPLIEHWNGKSWSRQQTDAFTRWKALAGDVFVSVAALAPNNVWVLGYPGTNSPDQNLHWNGKSWRLFNGPNIWQNFGTQAMQVLTTDHFGGLWAAGGTIRGNGEAGVPGTGVVERWNGSRWQVDSRYASKKPLTFLAPVAPDDVWAITGGNFSTSGTYGISPVEVLHSNGSAWKLELNLGGTASVTPAGLAATSADDAYVIGQNANTGRAFIDHWDGTRWQSVPPGHVQPPASNNNDTPSLTVTSGGSIAALAPTGQNDHALYLWLRC